MLPGGGAALGVMVAFASLAASAATFSSVTSIVVIITSAAGSVAAADVAAAGDAAADADVADAAEDDDYPVDRPRGQRLRGRQQLSERQDKNLICDQMKATDFKNCKDSE